MVDSYYVIYVRDWLEFSIALLSLLCSLLTLFIIKYMKIWNGNILLISTLTTFQILYDINFLFGISNYYDTCVLWNFLDILGGLGTSFTTNVIAFTMVYVTIRIRSINIIKNYLYFLIFIFLIPLTFAILTFFVVIHASRDDDKPYTTCVFNQSTLANTVQNFYYWSRLVSIILNFIAFWYISYKIRRLGFLKALEISRSASLSATGLSIDGPVMTLSEQQILAVQVLAMRMRFYPLAQAICRSGSAWDEFNNYQYSNNTSSLMASACSPLSGVFYMIIFLVMQPNAWKVLKSFLQGRPVRPPPPQPLAAKMNTAEFFRESVSQMDDAALENIINSPSMQIMNWTLNPAISMTRFSEATFRNSRMQQKTDDEEEDENESENVQYTESDQNSSHLHSSSVSEASDLERNSDDIIH